MLPCSLLSNPLQWRLLAQSPDAPASLDAGFIDSDWTVWMTPAVLSHLSAHGRWVDLAVTPVREELGIPLRCHFTALERLRERAGSQAYFGFGLYGYCGRYYWWLHSWPVEADGTLIDSAEGRDSNTRYFGAPWSWALLKAVCATPDHPFESILLDGLRGVAPGLHQSRTCTQIQIPKES